MFFKEKAKFVWFRDYDQVRADFQGLLLQGEGLLNDIRARKKEKSTSLSGRLSLLRDRFDTLRAITLNINESHQIRKHLARAEVSSREAEIDLHKENFVKAEVAVNTARSYLARAEEAVYQVLGRYRDEEEISRWKRWAEETIAESQSRGIVALVVSKLERTLTVYRKGKAVAVYSVGLGRFGLSDKLHAGDDATPEGRYKVVKKLETSQFYKALLLNYPNEEDLHRFRDAKKNGLLPSDVGVGGLIEIHGGGEDSVTRGCVSVENEVMDKIFPLVGVGTSVTIVGTTGPDGGILSLLRKL